MTIKLALLKSGEEVIADWQEMVVEERVVAYMASYPYNVKLNKTDIPSEDEPAKVGLSFFPWIPLSKETNIPIPADWLITMVEPVYKLKEINDNLHKKIN